MSTVNRHNRKNLHSIVIEDKREVCNDFLNRRPITGLLLKPKRQQAILSVVRQDLWVALEDFPVGFVKCEAFQCLALRGL